jgi:predicted nucleic acid-binding protein
MIVVADAGPLIALGRIGRLDLLRSLYPCVRVPAAVWHEVVTEGERLPGATTLAAAEWVERQDDRPLDPLFLSLLGSLDRGEAAAITCAVAGRADLLLIDECKGRAAARRLGLTVKGTLGVLLAARRGGYIEALAPSIEALRAAGIHLSDGLVAEILRAAGEA